MITTITHDPTEPVIVFPPGWNPNRLTDAEIARDVRNLFEPTPEPPYDDSDLFVGASYKPGHDSDLPF